LHENTAEAGEYIRCEHSAIGCYDTILLLTTTFEDRFFGTDKWRTKCQKGLMFEGLNIHIANNEK
jgi:hypothetical protein